MIVYKKGAVDSISSEMPSELKERHAMAGAGYFDYSGENTRNVVFPLGGIGAGCIGIGGDGRLRDWEIFNRPSKGSVNGFSHFAVRAEQDGKVLESYS